MAVDTPITADFLRQYAAESRDRIEKELQKERVAVEKRLKAADEQTKAEVISKVLADLKAEAGKGRDYAEISCDFQHCLNFSAEGQACFYFREESSKKGISTGDHTLVRQKGHKALVDYVANSLRELGMDVVGVPPFFMKKDHCVSVMKVSWA